MADVRIVCADARDVIGKCADATVIITDPVWPNCPPGLLAGADRPYELLAETLALAPPSIVRVVIIMRSDSDPRFLTAVPRRWPFVCLQAMSYAVPMYLGRVLGGTEIAYCFGEPISFAPGRRVIPMWAPKETQARATRDDVPAGAHPCPRSLMHMRWLVNWWSESSDIVLDPFCGSGTIPLGAIQLGRNAIGIEIEPRYAAFALARCAAADPLLRRADG